MTAVDAWPIPPVSDAGNAAYWEWVRVTPTRRGDDQSHISRIKQVVRAVRWALTILGAPADGAGVNLLDVSAGLGFFGRVLREDVPNIRVDCTEQSPELVRLLRQAGVNGSVAEWSSGRADGGTSDWSLRDTLGKAPELFCEQYDLVTTVFVADCVANPYALLDNCWEMVTPGGALVVAVQRNFEQRAHISPMDWDKLLGVMSAYGVPTIVFEDGTGGCLVTARFKQRGQE